MYKFTVIWQDGKRDTHFYETREKAEKVMQGFYTAFGNQINYAFVDRVYPGLAKVGFVNVPDPAEIDSI